MTFVFEVSRPFQWRPGYHRSDLMVRAWWGWFAVGFINRGFAQFCRDVMGRGWDPTNQFDVTGGDDGQEKI